MNAIERPIIYGFLVIALLFLWDARCSRNIGDEISVKVPEVKGTLQTSKPLVHTPIVWPSKKPSNNGDGRDKSTIKMTIVGHKEPTLKSENDRLNQLILLERDLRFEAFKKLDSIKKIKFVSDLLQPMDVTQTLENDTIKISMLAKVSGTMHNVKLDYTIKPYKINIKTYSLFLGSTIGNNTTNGKTFVSPQIMYLNPSGMLFYGGRDLFSDTYNVGVAKKIFGFSK